MVSFERRKEKRFAISAPARLELNGFGQKSIINLTTANVSAGGFYLETLNPRPTGTPVWIEIVLPHRVFRRFGGSSSRAKAGCFAPKRRAWPSASRGITKSASFSSL